MDKDKDKDKDKAFYADLIQAYRLDKDYCHTALDELKQAVIVGNWTQVEDRLDWLTKHLDGLTKTADVVVELFKERLKSEDEHSGDKEDDDDICEK